MEQSLKVGIMQPYFMPYIGYWQLMSIVDKYVVYDDVNYIKDGYSNRNNILMQGEAKRFTISVAGVSSYKKYNELSVSDDFRKFYSTLEACYKKAPYYNLVIELLHMVTDCEDKTLGVFMKHSFQIILDYLNIQTELILSSSIQKDNGLRGSEKVIEICKILGATDYINAIGGQKLYDYDDFKMNGINLHFLKTDTITYKQFANDFVPNLSIIDILMFNSPDDISELLTKYTLIES